MTDPRSKVTTYEYDDAGRLVGSEDALGNEVAYDLDDNGNRTGWDLVEVDGLTTVTHSYEATYDALNRMVTRVEIDRTDANNRLTTTFDHDSRSNLVWMVNAEGNPSRWTFDGLSRMTKQEVALSVGDPIEDFTTAQVVEWGFDTNNRLTSHKDDHAYETTWTYDALDRPVTQTYPDSTYISLTYDASDNVTQTIDAAGNDIDDTFDSLNRRTARNITPRRGVHRHDGGELRVRRAQPPDRGRGQRLPGVLHLRGARALLDPVHRGAGVRDGLGVHEDRDDEVRVDRPARDLEYPSGLDLTYTYNDINALSSVTDGTNTIASFSYIGTRPKTITFGNGTTQTNTYGGFREDLTTVHHETSTPARSCAWTTATTRSTTAPTSASAPRGRRATPSSTTRRGG